MNDAVPASTKYENSSFLISVLISFKLIECVLSAYSLGIKIHAPDAIDAS